MAFSDTFQSIRRIGREIVLPTERIKSIIRSSVMITEERNILDLGAGTLYWSKWLCQNFRNPVLAVDSYYNDSFGDSGGGIQLYNDYFKCIRENDVEMLFMCDVIHHLDSDFRKDLLHSIIDMQVPWVVIKDIDCRKTIGNFLNRTHDFLINREIVQDVNPESFISFLKKHGYTVDYYDIPKLWYPHFLIVSQKNVAKGHRRNTNEK